MRHGTFDDYVEATCVQFGLPREILLSGSRLRYLARSRFALFYVLSSKGYTDSHIGQLVGRDRKTIASGLEQAIRLMGRDKDYKQAINEIATLKHMKLSEAA